MSSLFLFLSLLCALANVVISSKDVGNNVEVLAYNPQAIAESFGGLTEYTDRQVRQKQKKKKKDNGNHGLDEQNDSGENHTPGENRKKQKNQNSGAPHPTNCGKKFQYVADATGWHGTIKIKNININFDNYVEVDFQLPPGLHQNSYQGRIELATPKESIYEAVTNGIPLLFRVIFASQNPVPRLVSIYKNNRDICGTPPFESSDSLVTFRLSYLLRAVQPSPGVSGVTSIIDLTEGHQSPQRQQPIQTYEVVIRSQEPSAKFQDDNLVCGIPVIGLTQSLIVGGQSAGRGEWPWLVAFYRSKNGNLEFICGGSLISSRYTLTAAHCIQDKGRDVPLSTQNALLFVGKHNLIHWNEEGFEKKGAKSFKIHPDWNPNDAKYDADLALIEMESAVKYSKFIRPVCLWNGQVDVARVVGQTGIVAGWGRNDAGELNTDFPKIVNAPIVSDGQCLRTHEAFLHITSDRTFCAGGRAGEGPCQGDSGGGLVLKSGRKWFLRGIVSASLREENKCDLNNYAVFTDVAKFISWIKNQI